MYKLENNTLISCPDAVIFEGNAILNPYEEVQIALGYKHLTTSPKGSCEWYEVEVCNYTEDATHIFENWSAEAQSNLQSLYIERLLIELDRKLWNDFTWAGKVVKLSESNQKDYLASFTLSNANPAMYIPITYTFKDNAKHTMDTLQEVIDFTNSAFYFMSVTLEAFRLERDKALSMTNDELYEYLKTL